MMIDLSDRVAIVTGGASGIGRGISLVLAGQGANVVVADINTEGAESVAGEIAGGEGRSMAMQVDVTDVVSADNMVQRALERFGSVDILVNDAGVIGADGWWERETPSAEDWDIVLAVNLRGLVNASEAVAPHMRERRHGKIVNIASVAARRGAPRSLITTPPRPRW